MSLVDEVAALPGVACARLVSRRRNGTRVVLQTYRRGALDAATSAGPLLFCVNGMCGCADNFIFQLRTTKHAFFCYDLVGCGRSGELAGANIEATFFANIATMYAPAQLVDDIENAWRYATDNGARPCIVVAHSYGTSLVTQWLAAKAPHGDAPSVGAVLLGTHASLPPLARTRAARFMRALPLALQYTAIELFQGPARWWRLLCGGEGASAGTLGVVGGRSAAARRLWLRWEREKSPALYAASVCTFSWATPADFARAYAATPLAVCWGDADRMTPPDPRFAPSATAMALAPGDTTSSRPVAPALVSIKMCSGYGHWPMLDNAEFDAWFGNVVGALSAPHRGTPPLPLPLDTPPPSTESSVSSVLFGDDAMLGASVSMPLCETCGGHASGRCAGVLGTERQCTAAYCGTECQELAWKRGHDHDHDHAHIGDDAGVL